jgi:hypothetical protein
MNNLQNTMIIGYVLGVLIVIGFVLLVLLAKKSK